MDQTAGPINKFDPVRILSQAASYARHLRLMVLVFAFALLSGTAYFLYATPLYQATSVVFFQSFGSPLRESELPEAATFTSRASRTLIARLRSQELQIATGERMGLLGETRTYQALLEHVPVLRVSIIDPRHLEITVQAYNPAVARTYCETLVGEFQRLQEGAWTEFRDEALKRYQTQLTDLEAKVEENVDSLTSMERDQKLTEVTIEQQNLLEIPKQLVETRERLTRMDSVRKSLESYEADETGDQTITILSLLSNFEKDSEVSVGNIVSRPLGLNRTGVAAAKPTDIQVVTPADVEPLEPWRELEREKREIEAQIKESSAILLPEHPKMKQLADRLDGVKRSLGTEMQVLREKFDLEHKRLTDKVAELQRRIPEYQEVTEKLGRSSLEYSSIEQTRLMWDKARERLAEKLAAVTFSEDFDWVQLRFKGHTSLRDQDPVSPSKRKLVMLSLLLGLAGAIGVPTVLNLLDNTANSLGQLEDYVGLKGLGIVPLADKGLLEEIHRSPAQGSTVPNYLLECFRVIRANIGLDARFDGVKSQVILVTSARPQEGKTTLSANLAWAYRSLGEKVLLIDCDLRRGRQHLLLGLDNDEGMSHMLTGLISPLTVVQSTDPDGFDTVTRGPIIPGATELLCQEGFAKLMQHWRSRYDRIILDCPPVLGLSESFSLQRLADGIVLLVRSESTAMKDVRDAVAMLRKTGAHFFGFVLNGVDLSKVGNYYQYYYYSAPYYDQLDEDTEEGNPRTRVQPPRGGVAAESESPPSPAVPPAIQPDAMTEVLLPLRSMERPLGHRSSDSPDTRRPSDVTAAATAPSLPPLPSSAPEETGHKTAPSKIPASRNQVGWSDSPEDLAWFRAHE
jgi:capsular exopolysaccharide synthesis family protein